MARHFSRLFLVLALCPWVAPAAFAESPAEIPGDEAGDSAEARVHIPEPLVFDLVRPLGARQGEIEVNVLTLAPMNDTSDREVDWAPEIEMAVLDGVALEFELPFEDAALAAYKLAGQWTFGTAFGERFIHGVQFIAETARDDEIWELTPLYIAGFRFDERWSALCMLGYRAEVGSDVSNSNELVANPSIFWDASSRMSLGLESNYSTDFEGDWRLLVMPQLHYELFGPFELQVGAGLEVTPGRSDGSAAARLIASW